MDHVLIVLKTGSNEPFALAVQEAHWMACERPFLVDFPGIDNPSWSTSRQHALGRVMLLYAQHDFCQEVANKLENYRRHDMATMVVPADVVVERAIDPRDRLGRRLQRRTARKLSPKAALRAASRLQRHLQKLGRPITHPIVVDQPKQPRLIERNGRWHVRKPDGSLTPHYLVLTSSSGGRFTNVISRDPVDQEVLLPSGQRDGYGFGGIVPNICESTVVAELLGL